MRGSASVEEICGHGSALHPAGQHQGHYDIFGRIGHTEFGISVRAVACGEAQSDIEDRASAVSIPNDAARSIRYRSVAVEQTSGVQVS